MPTRSIASALREVTPLMLFGALLLFPLGSAAAQANREPRQTLRVREMLSLSEAGGTSSGAAAILQQRKKYPPAKIDSLVGGLERLAITAATPIARMSAAGALANAGAGEDPLPGAFDRIVAVYRRSGEDLVRRIILSNMSIQHDKERAIAFLKVVAGEPPDSQDFTSASLSAVSKLGSMGDPGLAALAQLRESGALRDGKARGYVEWYFRERK